MIQGRKRKMAEKEATAEKKVVMPEVFISNNMKQQRNYVQYKREKAKYQKTKDGKVGVAP